MHVALLIDEERIERERPLLNRLVIALIDEGAQITRVVPEGLDPEDVAEREVGLTNRIDYAPQVVPWMKHKRIERVADAFEKSTPDIIHVVGRGAWDLGINLAAHLDIPASLEFWSLQEARHAPRRHAAERIAAYVAATKPLAATLRRRVDPERVAMVPIGVPIPPNPCRVLERSRDSIVLAAIGRCRDVAAYRGMLEGVTAAMADFPQIQLMLELDGSRHHEIWRMARDLGLLDRLTALDHAEAHRRLLVQCDALLAPERSGEVRPLMLSAMAAGLPILTPDDPYLDMLSGERTAFVTERAGADEWAGRLRDLLQNPEAARLLGREGRAWTQAHHQTTAHAERLFGIFEQIHTGGTHTFQPVDKP